MDFTRKGNSRANMTEQEKATNKARDEELLKKNLETMKKVPNNEMGAAIRAFGEAANKKLQQDINNAATNRAPNSRAQYQHEREAGDPNATSLSFEKWKKL